MQEDISNTDLTVKSAHIGIGKNLRDVGAEREDAVRRITIRAEVEVQTQRDQKSRALFWSSHHQELGHFERRLALCARVGGEHGVIGDGGYLRNGVLEKHIVGGPGRKRVRVRRRVLQKTSPTIPHGP